MSIIGQKVGRSIKSLCVHIDFLKLKKIGLGLQHENALNGPFWGILTQTQFPITVYKTIRL